MSDDQNSNGCGAGMLFFLAYIALLVMLFKHWAG